MSQPSLDQLSSRRSSKLDRATFASVTAMVTMCVFVLAQQLHTAPLFAAAGSVGASFV